MLPSRRQIIAAAYAGGCMAACVPAMAQVPPEVALAAAPLAEAGTQVYLPHDFAAFGPRTALDMVQQLPGFSIEGAGNGGAGGQSRGLGQATGNVLLNGERLASKSSSVTDQLARIPAANVVRIELVEGATLNIPGLSGRVANIVASSTDGLQGQFEWRPQLAAEYADHRLLDGIVSVSGTTGALNFTVAVEGKPFRNGNGGLNRITYGDGRIEDLFSVTRSRGDDTRYSASARYTTAGGLVANLSSSYLLRRFRNVEDETLLAPADLPPAVEAIRATNRGHDFEIGGDLDFDLGPGRMKLIALSSFARVQSVSQSVTDPATGAAATGSQFNQFSETGERIGRAEYSWPMAGADWQLSVEGAFNKLDRTGSLFTLSPAGAFEPLPFPFGSGGVRESRFESLLSYSRPLTGNLSMQLILGGEYSSITQTGNDALSRTFQRPKGSINLAWAPAEGLDISLKIEKRVGQLNFGDFLAAVNLTDDNQNSSNNQLRPDQSLGGELEVSNNFGDWGSATARVFYRRFTDFVTIIPTSTGGEARGNIESARIMGGEVSGTLRLDRLGIAGARFDVTAQLRNSRFIDPVEGGFIPVQFAQPHNFEIDFRHDIPGTDFAYGGGYRETGHNPYYRVREFGSDFNVAQNLQIFIEHKDVFGLTVQARLGNILEREAVRERFVFSGPRGTAPLAFSEYRVREIGKVFSFTVKGSF